MRMHKRAFGLAALLIGAALVMPAGLAASARGEADETPATRRDGGAEETPATGRDGGAAREMHSASRFLHQLGGDFWHLPSRDSALWLSIGSIASITVHASDRDAVERLATSHRAETVFEPGFVIGSEAFLAPATLLAYGVGCWADRPHLSGVAGDLMRAQIVAQTMTFALKVSVQRERPNRSDKYSFPSGHASGSFAVASVLHRAYGWKTGAVAYALASYVGVSRLTERKHYLSDVLFGSTLGIISGRTVTRSHPAGHEAESTARQARLRVLPWYTRDGAGLVLLRMP